MDTGYKPGFQGSETSWVAVTLYSRGDDPIIMTPGNASAYPFSGKRADAKSPSLVAVSTQKLLGAASGSFQIDLKPSRSAFELFKHVCDDDWIDITFYRKDQPWHVMRGLVDEIRRNQTVGGTGATVESYTIVGKDFGKIWEITPIWFSPYMTNDIISDATASAVFNALTKIQGAPNVAVKAYLWSFMNAITTHAGIDWSMPLSMPNGGGNFLGWVKYSEDHFQNVPKRKCFNANYMEMNGTLWGTAQQHSDPAFVELYTDLFPDGDPFSPKLEAGSALEPKDTRMTVVIRDRPFPIVDKNIDAYNQDWDNLPMFIVPRQQIITANVGRSGLERFNAFYTASMLHQEAFGGNSLNIIVPLIDAESIHQHGLRRFDIQSSIAPDESNLDFSKLCYQQRLIAKDWHALNPYFLSGTLGLGVGRPDLKIGCKVRIPGSRGEEDQETYYLESVGHSWSFGQGTRTNLGITRGWIGSDWSMLEALQKISSRFKEPEMPQYDWA